MDIKKIETLIKLMKKHALYELEVEEDESRVHLVSAAGGAPVYAAPAPSPMFATDTPTLVAEVPAGKELRSPFVGTFYSSPSPDAEPFVRPGQQVRKGDVLCIIEAMKIMNEIEAEMDCTIKKILVNNESPVEFDQPLFVFE